MTDAAYWIGKLALKPHPEGGYYRETYRSGLATGTARGARTASTAIYFLLDGENFSAFHRIASDEMWHFYAGASLSVHLIDRNGAHRQIMLGGDAEAGEVFQAVVPAGVWFASCLTKSASYALVGCSVAPGFEFEDFELARRSELSAEYPQHRELIRRLTRQ
ncbi:MAG TPA: cupin domain-containing protein [Bryobacteraceae bacterium]|jgi:hypothetical protein|nr:cupin domain-containing protein [Bryobacteraceae bacterium]